VGISELHPRRFCESLHVRVDSAKGEVLSSWRTVRRRLSVSSHILICHFPSRWKGKILSMSPNLNDGGKGKSVKEGIPATRPDISHVDDVSN
jgi:hypothetical protein